MIPSMHTVPTRWHYRAFISFHLFALLLLASWLWEPSRVLWDSFDNVILLTFNASLAEKSAWSAFWAIANVRMIDVATGITMLLPLLRGNWVANRSELRQVFFTFLVLLVFMLLIRLAFVAVASHVDFGAQRASPSLLHDGIIRLSELYPQWPVKDASSNSFPGDHASVLLIWAMFLSYFTRGWRLMLVWALALLYMLPRLFAGAHWASDDFVGGLFIACIAYAWGCYTPYAFRAGAWLADRLRPYLLKFNRFPVIGRLDIFRDS